MTTSPSTRYETAVRKMFEECNATGVDTLVLDGGVRALDRTAIAACVKVGICDAREILDTLALDADPRQVVDFFRAGVTDFAEMGELRDHGVTGELLMACDTVGISRSDARALASGGVDGYLLRRLGDRGLRDPQQAIRLAATEVVRDQRFNAATVASLEMCGVRDTDTMERLLVDAALPLWAVRGAVRDRRWLTGTDGTPDVAAMAAAVGETQVRVRSNGSMITLVVRNGFELSTLDPEQMSGHLSFDALGGDGRLSGLIDAWDQQVHGAGRSGVRLPDKLWEASEAARRVLVAAAWVGRPDLAWRSRTVPQV